MGLCYLRVPTWLPFRLRFYFNGHAWLASELCRAAIAFRMEDNAFVEIADWPQAQVLSDAFPIQALNADLNALARQYVPFLKQFPSGYYWSLMQVEYSWDLSWKRAADLAPVYAEVSRQAILTVKAPDVAKFLGKRLSPEAALTSDFRTRIEGTRIRHSLGPASLKLYDKRGRVLRLECTANDVTFFKHYRKVEPDMNMARTIGDMLFWMLKQFQLLKAQGRGQAIKPEWEASMKKLAEALMSTWKKDGQWGKLINVKTGIVAEYNTTGGATIIGALALASDYFNNPEYLTVAKEAAEFYYVRDFVTLGHTTGGCADILQNADSETAAGFMTSLMALYEISGDKQWLEKSRNLANLVATWTVSHDYQLPKTTELGGLGANLAGVYWASTQNKHGAPGICTSSGDALFKIYRTTGSTRYAELLRDIVAAHGESIRPGGFTNERLTFCDADSRGSRGDHVTGWNELNGILMAMELPGIYLRTDKDDVFIFDHQPDQDLRRHIGLRGSRQPGGSAARHSWLPQVAQGGGESWRNQDRTDHAGRPDSINPTEKFHVQIPTRHTRPPSAYASNNCRNRGGQKRTTQPRRPSVDFQDHPSAIEIRHRRQGEGDAHGQSVRTGGRRRFRAGQRDSTQ